MTAACGLTVRWNGAHSYPREECLQSDGEHGIDRGEVYSEIRTEDQI